MTEPSIRQHPLCWTWYSMKARCNNPADPSYDRYGGRGIRVCDRWLASFWDFVADIGERPEGSTLDRIDNDGDYRPGNVQWSTRRAQQNNMRSNRVVIYEGREMTVPALAKLVGMPATVLRNRLVKNWSVERAVSQKVRKSPCVA